MAILIACFNERTAVFSVGPSFLSSPFVANVHCVHMHQEGDDPTLVAFEFVVMPGVALNISRIPKDVFIWRSFQCSNPLKQILDRHCDSRSAICHATVVPIPTSQIFAKS